MNSNPGRESSARTASTSARMTSISISAPATGSGTWRDSHKELKPTAIRKTAATANKGRSQRRGAAGDPAGDEGKPAKICVTLVIPIRHLPFHLIEALGDGPLQDVHLLPADDAGRQVFIRLRREHETLHRSREFLAVQMRFHRYAPNSRRSRCTARCSCVLTVPTWTSRTNAISSSSISA